MNNWDALYRLIVPLSFMAIWALTSLFNRETKAKPPLRTAPFPPNPRPAIGPRGGEPTLRWNVPGNASTANGLPNRSESPGNDDDGIVILSSDNPRGDRQPGRSSSGMGGKRPTKGKPVIPQRKNEPAPTRARLAGVSQNVNQHLANTNIEMTPLTAMPSASAMPSLGLSSAPSATPDTIGVSPRSATAQALADPKRLREAFLLNEILLPPVSMRKRRIGPTPP